MLTSLLGANQAKPGVSLSCTVPLCLAQVEYSQRYAETTQAHSLWHLLSEAHILLRAALLQRGAEQQSSEGGTAESQHTEPQKQKNHGELDEALKQNCAQLGDCFSRSDRENACEQLPWPQAAPAFQCVLSASKCILAMTIVVKIHLKLHSRKKRTYYS